MASAGGALDLKSTIVIDNGSGFTKMGFSGNLEPSFVVPSTSFVNDSSSRPDYISDLDFYLSDEVAGNLASSYAPKNPMDHGKITDWTLMERMWHRSIYKYLRCNPEEHAFMLTESPLNTPENREYTAEIMFETFNVPYLYIAVQAVLSLAAEACINSPDQCLPELGTISGVAVESGDGVTCVVPVAYGYTIGSAVRTMPLAGKDITRFIAQMLKDRKEPVPPECSMEVANYIKENYCYAAGKGIVKEYRSFDKKPASHFKTYEGINPRRKTPFTVDVGYEQFLGPEAFFNPEILNPKLTTGLPQMIDEAVLACPIDVRRDMYKNIVLSGGSTLFEKLRSRLQKEISGRVTNRLEANAAKIAAKLGRPMRPPAPLDVNVTKLSGKVQQYAVWLGGSLLAEQPNFTAYCHSKAQYDEEGPRIARSNRAY